MYVKDGICYADNQAPLLKVTYVKPLYGGMYKVTFSTGETRLFDTTLLKGEVFEPLKDPEILSNPKICHGVITWDNEEIDVAPEFVYDNSFPYNTENVISADPSPDFNNSLLPPRQ